MVDQTDLFGASPDQGSLFGDSDDRMVALQRQLHPDPEKIRTRLTELLHVVRGADSLPWPEREARMWQAVFPNMTNWLPPEEGEQLRFEFAQELERLRLAA